MKNKTMMLISGMLFCFASMSALSGCGNKTNKFLTALENGDAKTIAQIANEADASFFDTIAKEKAAPGGDFSYEFNDTEDGVVITWYSGTAKSVIIPAEIEGYPVVEIGESAFESTDLFETKRTRYFDSILIPPSVTKIGSRAFIGCSFKAMVIPDSVKILEDYAFKKCNKLVFVKLSNNLKKIGKECFMECSALHDITIQNSVEIIGQKAFMESGLYTINFPASLKTVEEGAFYNCYELYDISISDTLTHINFSEKYRLFNHFGYCGKLKLSTRKRLKELGYKGGF